jgi:hypothetical protein
MIKFEWDIAKAASNLKKHGISFKEAESVFYDEFAVHTIKIISARKATKNERKLYKGSES